MRKTPGRVVVLLVALSVMIFATGFVQFHSGGVYQQWSGIWTFEGTKWVNLGSVGCWSADDNPLGYVNHWRYHGGWIYVDENGKMLPWGYGLWQGYSYPDGPRQSIGPRDVAYTTDFYKCWNYNE